MSNEVVMICSDGPSSSAVYTALRGRFGDFVVILEDRISRWHMATRRAKRLGVLKAAGQVLFVSTVVPLLHRTSKRRIAQIEQEFGLEKSWNGADIRHVASVNSNEARDVLRSLRPKVVVVNGTRIVGAETLECVDAYFINTHAGITPLYRGVHGAYWALADGKPDLVGTTVHLVDRGIDTGEVIGQAFFRPTEQDNFATYPYLHTAAGIPLLVAAVENAMLGEIEAIANPRHLDSKLRYHPTLFEYLRNRIRRGVK